MARRIILFERELLLRVSFRLLTRRIDRVFDTAVTGFDIQPRRYGKVRTQSVLYNGEEHGNVR